MFKSTKQKTVDRSVAAFDSFANAVLLIKKAPAKSSSAKSGATTRGFSGTQIFNTIGAMKEGGDPITVEFWEAMVCVAIADQGHRSDYL